MVNASGHLLVAWNMTDCTRTTAIGSYVIYPGRLVLHIRAKPPNSTHEFVFSIARDCYDSPDKAPSSRTLVNKVSSLRTYNFTPLQVPLYKNPVEVIRLIGNDTVSITALFS